MRLAAALLFAAVAAPLPAIVSGCGTLSAPPPLRAPPLAVEAAPHAGTPLTGPLAVVEPDAAAAPFAVRLRGAWVEQSVRTEESLATRAGLVLALGESDPLRPFARRADAVGLLRGAQARAVLADLDAGRLGRTSPAWDERATLDAGTTLRVRATGDAALGAPSIVLDAARAGPAAEARLAVRLGLDEDPERETVVLEDALRTGEGPIVLVFPRVAGLDEAAALLALIEAVEAGRDAPAGDRVRASAAAAEGRRRALERSEEERREIEALLGQLDRPKERRARLVTLAGWCGAPLALDLALIAAEADLAEFATAARAALAEHGDRRSSAWPLERAAWLFVARRAVQGTLAPELSGVLARQGGEAARFPGAIEDLLRGVQDVAALVQRLAAENRILLEDASPAARARAFDWLRARGLAPEGYDPFGTLHERRAALQRAEAAAAHVSEGGG
ncbi:MAG: hypothetical protein JNK02_13935 [Planctomycetes bacterium]|nr:hypothetical protein [Planctomycetota bacterium]